VRISAGTAQPIKHQTLDHRSGPKPHVNGRLKRRRYTEQTTISHDPNTTKFMPANGASTLDAYPSAQVPVRTPALICPRNRIGAQRYDFSYSLRNIFRVNHFDACGIGVDAPKYGKAFILICHIFIEQKA